MQKLVFTNCCSGDKSENFYLKIVKCVKFMDLPTKY